MRDIPAKAIKTLTCILLVSAMMISLSACGSSSKDSGRSSSSTSASKSYSVPTPSLRDRGKMLWSDEEVAEDRKLSDYEDQYRFWQMEISDMQEWYNSGQQRAEWRDCMDGIISEISAYPPASIPSQYSSAHQEILRTFINMRNQDN